MVVALALLFGALSGFYIDILWFREVELSTVFWTRFWTRLVLAVVFGAIFFVLLYANLLLVRRLRPQYRAFSPEEEAVERYRSLFEPYAKWALPAIALVFAAFAAAGVAAQWERFQLWQASGQISFGVTDPVYGRDVGFYVLRLPFERFVQSWLFTSLVVITIVTAGAHYLWGGIRIQAVTDRVTPQVKAHLSVLLGLIVLVKAWGYRIEQYDLLTSPRGTVTGASFTDVNAQLPALRLLVIIAVVSAVLFLVNIRFRGWALPALSLGLLVLISIVAGAIYPAFIQRFRVAPQELRQEQEFIERNISFTREAFGLDVVERRTFLAEPEIEPEEVEAATVVLDNIRLWNPDVLRQSYLQLQRIRPYYEFRDVDVDRYEIDGQRRTVMLTVREIAQDGIRGGGQTWQNRHLFYTHGYGAVASRVDQVTTEGSPAFIVRDIPETGALAPELTEPRVYFQEAADAPFVVVGTEMDEFDFPETAEGDERFARHRYTGDGGIEIGGLFRQLMFAWRYRDVNLLISDLIDSDSRVLINTELSTRVRKIAPFLQYDWDPYIAVVDGRLVWIWDAYTTSDAYPYSERMDLTAITRGVLGGQANYIRNSVKVVVDAYDGTTTFYQVDEEDPIIQAWDEVFPDLLTPLSAASPDLRAHFRYPENLFRIQSVQYANYHVTDPAQFYAKEDFWSVPLVAQDPSQQATDLEPYYILLPLPGQEEEGERFVLFTPFTPAERPNMVAWLAADSDPEQYGRLVSYEFEGRNVTGPAQAAALISQDPDVAQQVTLLGQLGSRVIYGDLLAIPMGQSFLYVQPLYTRSAQEASAIPELKRVILVNGGEVTMGASLPQALELAFGEVIPEIIDDEVPPPDDLPGPAPDVAELLAEAEEHFQRAEAALQEGDLATYQREIDAARRAIEEAIAISQGEEVPEDGEADQGGGDQGGGG